MKRVDAWILAAAGVGAVAATLAPESLVGHLRESVIGFDDAIVTVTVAQRAIAVLGVAFGALALRRLALSPAKPHEVPAAGRLASVAVPLAAAAICNVAPPIREHTWLEVGDVLVGPYLAGLAIFALVAFAVLGGPLARDATRRPHAALEGIAAGAAYGCVSALWHCCPPLWAFGAGGAAGVSLVLVVGSILLAGFTSAVGLAIGGPFGLAASGAMLAAVYPWHTAAWAAQCFVAGAFFAWLARRTGSLIAPGLALATAFLVHMTLPFVGWAGPAIALALLAAVAAQRSKQPRSVTPIGRGLPS